MSDNKKANVICGELNDKKYRIVKIYTYSDTEFTGDYKGHFIEIQQNESTDEWCCYGSDCKWLIYCDGLYEGYWGAYDTSIKEAITECLRGSMLVNNEGIKP